ncbi:MAG TPA: ABC transporter substrate-binding protein [Methyloceanibacter sp.]|jgi:4,5-dihydroxyphthalate decarboxylase|nr:ABC transporter substrate-binding protein [Methyloceanibacter sp.]
MPSKLRLTIATTDYDHVRDLRFGLVQPEGIEVTYLCMGIHEIFARFAQGREWEVSELSFAKFIAQATEPDADIIGLPVFLARRFRFQAFIVNKKGPVKTPQDLKGKRIGIPEWAQTATVYTRGWLQHEVGVPLDSVEWVQAGENEAGREEKVESTLPKGVRLTRIADKSLSEMLVSGEIDCMMSAGRPVALRNPDIGRLMPNYQEFDREFFERTRVYPIMHIVAMRKSVLEKHRWAARNLFNAFEEAKDRAVARALRGTPIPVPWLSEYAREMQGEFGEDLYPYGIEPNRPTLEHFLRYAYEQGVAKKHVKPEEIFPEGIMTSVKI